MALGKLLQNTIFEYAYSLFGVGSDTQLIERMVWIGALYTGSVTLYNLVAPAPYGRYATSKIFTLLSINPMVAWMIQESPSALVCIALHLLTPAQKFSQFANMAAVSLFVLHYLNRGFVFPMRLASGGNPVPIMVMLSAFVYTLYNGLLQGHHLLNVRAVSESDAIFAPIGVAIFLTGMYLNIYHDNLLTKLKGQTKPGERKEYKIPRGGLFEYISAANYFGEIVEWIGFAIITRSPPQILFAFFSASFLGLRAIHHHKYYKEKFGDRYPASRKAVIPFIL